MRLTLAVIMFTLLSSCATVDHTSNGATLLRDAKWALLPILNHTDVPQAGLRAEAITESLLRARGIGTLLRYPAALNPDTLFDPAERKVQDDARAWAREQGVRYAVYGAVDEWRYKVGVDGEPAVGITLSLFDLQSGEVTWSAVGAKSGWSRESLAGVAQKLIRELLSSASIR
jgi:hypothetical protein